MPSCSNQSGYNSADSNAGVQLSTKSQQAAHNVQLAQGGNPVPGANSIGWTAVMASEYTWYLFSYYLQRVPSGAENAIWANMVYNKTATPLAVRTTFATCSECYTLFGCS